MTEEENKAIEDLKKILKYWQTIVDIEDDVEREIEMNCYSEEMPFKQLKIALNLIEKNAKEIEYLKKNQRYKKDFNGDKIFCLEYDKETLRDMVLEKQEEIKELKSNSIPKDKIRELIKKDSEIDKVEFEDDEDLNYERKIIDVDYIEELLEEEY